MQPPWECALIERALHHSANFAGIRVNFALRGRLDGPCAHIRKLGVNHLLATYGAIFAYPSLQRLRKRIDPRRVNGGVFLGLNGTVIKSHGDADSTGVAAAISLAYQLAKLGFAEKLAARVASSVIGVDDTAE